MSKKNLIILVVVVIVLAGLAALKYKARERSESSSEYSVVYLSTGEVYIGHLSTFPDMELKDGYILTTVKDAKDPSKSNFQINPLTEALWAPKVLHVVKKNVVFYGPILPTSKIGEALVNKEKQAQK